MHDKSRWLQMKKKPLKAQDSKMWIQIWKWECISAFCKRTFKQQENIYTVFV